MQYLPYQIRSPQIFEDPLLFLLLMHYKTKCNMNPKADNCTFEMLYKQDETEMSLELMSSKSCNVHLCQSALNITTTLYSTIPSISTSAISRCSTNNIRTQMSPESIFLVPWYALVSKTAVLFFLRHQMHVMKLYLRLRISNPQF